MKKIIASIVLFACLSGIAWADQKVIVVTAGDGKPDLTEIRTLISQGWKVVIVSSAGAGTDSMMFRQFAFVFVLEKP